MSGAPLVLVVPHTHWDRAWYVPFEEFQRALVAMMDRAIELLESQPDLRFTADGQTAMIDDYLSIRPEQRARIDALVRAGRLRVGPWRILPDCFLVGGESIVRNLEMGIREAEALGGCMRVGLMPDSFGHPAQLPQILRGFGIESFVFSRGLHEDEAPAELQWQGPDGSSVLALFQVGGYFNGAGIGYPGGCETRRVRFHPEHALRQAQSIRAAQKPRSLSGIAIVHNGMDHLELQAEWPRLIESFRAKWPDAEFRIADYGEAAAEVAARVQGADLPRHAGELCYPHGDLLRGVNSSRVRLKQWNAECENALAMMAEPLEALASLVDPARPDERALLSNGWKLLLANQPHDDLCGCSCDAAHRANHARFGELRSYLDAAIRDTLRDAASGFDWSRGEGIPLVLFNAAPAERRGAVRVEWEVNRRDWARLRRGFALVDCEGKEVACAVVDAVPVVRAEVRNTYELVRVRADVDCGVLSGWGLRLLRIRPGGKQAPPAIAADAIDSSIENERLRLDLDSDGTVSIVDKATGRAWRGLHRVVDEGDRGDSYSFCPVEGESPVSGGTPHSIDRVGSTALCAVLRWVQDLRVPKGLSKDRKRRTKGATRIRLRVEARLRAGARMVEFTTTFTNTAKDHRLRVAFSTMSRASIVHAGSPFATVERPADPRDDPGYREAKSGTLCATGHFQGHVRAHDGALGLAVLAKGLCEVESRPNAEGVELVLTLLRATGWLSRGDLATRKGLAGPPIETPEGQCLGPHCMEYAAMPLGPGDEALVARAAQEFQIPVLAAQADFDTSPQWLKDDAWKKPIPKEGPLPPAFQLVGCADPRIVFSALRRLPDGRWETRFHNDSDAHRPARIDFGLPLAGRVERVELDGRIVEARDASQSMEWRLRPFEIATLRFEPRALVS